MDEKVNNNEKLVLTIGVTSYNRVDELKRLLSSIKTTKADKIEVLVSEDKSPKKQEIESLVSDFKKTAPFSVRFNSNKDNLGYDRNLKKIVDLSHGEYILYISDDDCLYEEALDVLLDIIEHHKVGVIYAPFFHGPRKMYRRKYKSDFEIEKGLDYASHHIYDSVLFSGLCFKRECLLDIDAEPFLNKNYIQAYMFMKALYTDGGYYSCNTMINCVEDGENAYGKSESAEKNPLLMDRSLALSKLEFQKGLIWSVKRFDMDFGTDSFKQFEKEYNIRSIVGMSEAAYQGKDTLKLFWEKMKTLEIHISAVSYLYYCMLWMFGPHITNTLLGIPRKTLKLARRGE